VSECEPEPLRADAGPAHQREVPQSAQRFFAVVVSPRQLGQVQVARPVDRSTVVLSSVVLSSVVVLTVLASPCGPVSTRR
jgi:hypothetical protein